MQDIIDQLKEIWDLHRIRVHQQKQAVDIIEQQTRTIDELMERIKELEQGKL